MALERNPMPRLNPKLLLALAIPLVLFVLLVQTNPTCQATYDPSTIPVLDTGHPVTSTTETIKDYARSEQNTYLTVPEWFIVYSSMEYTNCLKQGHPSQFPYFSSIVEYWQTYAKITQSIHGRYPLDPGEHVALFVIGTSYSVELAVKGVYENTIGRLSELLSTGSITPEEGAITKANQDYVDFIATYPFYEFSYASELQRFWSTTPLWSANPLRSWERKFAFTLEFSIKTVYGWIIKELTHAAYGTDFTTIDARIDGASGVLVIPRFQAFTAAVLQMATHNNVQYRDIAGNQHIVVSVIVPHRWNGRLDTGTELFTQEILTSPTQQRLILDVPVAQLSKALLQLQTDGAIIEHVYDY